MQVSLSPYASDHVPFLDAGIPAVHSIEGAYSANGNIHSDRDVLSTVTTALAMKILRMNAAALARWLEPVAAGQNSRAEGSSASSVARAGGQAIGATFGFTHATSSGPAQLRNCTPETVPLPV